MPQQKQIFAYQKNLSSLAFQFVASKREKTYIGDLGQVKNVYHDVTFVC